MGHTPEMRVCPTANPSTERVRGVSVGHFGGESALGPMGAEGPMVAPTEELAGGEGLAVCYGADVALGYAVGGAGHGAVVKAVKLV